MRYFYHQSQSNLTLLDPEGSEHPSLEEAKAEAIDAGRYLLADATRFGWDVTDWAFTLTDALNRPLAHIPFSSLLRRRAIS